jgi:dynein heavy chain 2, cytosolic
MKNTLQSLLTKCLEETKRSDSGADLSTYPSQILCLCEEITFTQQCESSITNNRLKNLKSSLKVYLTKIQSQRKLNKNIYRLDWMALQVS